MNRHTTSTAAVAGAAIRGARLVLALFGALQAGACTSLAGLKATGTAGAPADEPTAEQDGVPSGGKGIREMPRSGAAGLVGPLQKAPDAGTSDAEVERGGSGGTSGTSSAGRPVTPAAGTSGRDGDGPMAGNQGTATAGADADAATTMEPVAPDDRQSVSCKPRGVREVRGSHLLIHCSTKLTLNGHGVEYLALETPDADEASARVLELATAALLTDVRFEAWVTPSGAGNGSGCAPETCRTIRALSLTR